MWCDVAKYSDCWDASASISRVKHVLAHPNVGDLELSEPVWMALLRHAQLHMVTVGRPLGTVGWFPTPRFPPTR